MPVTRHDLADPFTDLAHLWQLSSRLWGRSQRFHPGELTWNRFQHLGREAERPTAWWESDGRTLAWGWIELPGDLNLQVDPDHPELAHEVLDWFESWTVNGRRDGSQPRSTVTIAEAERHLAAALTERGYIPRTEGPFFIHLERELDALPQPSLPPGFRVRAVAGESDAVARAAVHAAAFSLPGRPPSRVTADSYRVLMGRWPYRSGLDWLVEAEDGTPAAFCLVWKDDAGDRVCLEPVGCDPRFRRLGLATAACLAALWAARNAGAATARVCARGDDDYPSARALYLSLGFHPYARNLAFTKTA